MELLHTIQRMDKERHSSLMSRITDIEERLEGTYLSGPVQRTLVKIFVEQGEEALLKFISCKNLFIDDIGDEGERKVFKHFSNEMNVIRYVILKRYEFWLDEEKEWKTYATTNLSKGSDCTTI